MSKNWYRPVLKCLGVAALALSAASALAIDLPQRQFDEKHNQHPTGLDKRSEDDRSDLHFDGKHDRHRRDSDEGSGVDWPQWRFDGKHSATTPEELPASMQLQWCWNLPKTAAAWDAQKEEYCYGGPGVRRAQKVDFDIAYQPVVADNTVYYSSPNNDRVTALDLSTGAEKWRYYAGGPVRFAPVVYGRYVLFGSDDGFLHVVHSSNGELEKTYLLGPDHRKVLGNDRIISKWCVRGAPVLADDSVLYVGSGLYPFEGTFVSAFNLKTGATMWQNTGSSMYYTTQPHGTADAFSGISPQGYLCAVGTKLVVPNGRTYPAVLDRATGSLSYFRFADAGSSDVGGYFVCGDSTKFYNRNKAFNLSDGSSAGNAPIMLNENQVAIKAGTRMFTAGNLFEDEVAGVTSTTVKSDDGSFNATVDGRVVTMVASNGHLIVSTDVGKIYCFGAGTPSVVKQYTPSAFISKLNKNSSRFLSQILTSSQYRDGSKGICIFDGIRGVDVDVMTQMALTTDLTVIGFDSDPERIAKLRRDFDDAGLYGCKVHLINEEFCNAKIPPYVASIIVSECDDERPNTIKQESLVKEAFRVLRPYGGFALLNVGIHSARNALKGVSNASISSVCDLTSIRKIGQLPGTEQWNQCYANAAQSQFVNDTIVKLPMGVAWFGGSADNTNNKMLPRHGHGLIPLVAGGRIFQEGKDMLRAVDLYTGRVLWEKDIPNLGQYSDYTGHEAGHLALGNNLVAMTDFVYVLGSQNRCGFSTSCLKIDAATGATINEFALPGNVSWGMISVDSSYLVTTSDLLQFDNTIMDCYTTRADAGELVGPGDTRSRNGSMGLKMFVLDRNTGKVLWSRDAASGFFSYAIAAGNGKLFAIDQTLKQAISVMSRVGATVPTKTTPALYAFNVATGEVLWQKTTIADSIFGTWLSYSKKYDLLVESNANRSDYFSGEGSKKLAVYNGSTGEVKWKQLNRSFAGGPIMLDDTLIRTNGYTYNAISMFTGDFIKVPNPITGKSNLITGQKHYGCSFGNGSTNLIALRTGAAGFMDIKDNAGFGCFSGVKAGCTPSLVPAEGMIASPEYTRTCGCNYQMQTSYALVNDPNVDIWLSNENMAAQMRTDGGQIQNIGINFGAPGDRFDSAKTMWIEYPYGETTAGFASYSLPVNITVSDPNVKYTRTHSTFISGDLNWVGASAIQTTGSITVNMGIQGDATYPQNYKVDLVFAETEGKKAGERVFDVSVNGVTASGIDVAAEAGQNKVLMKSLDNVSIGSTMTITLTPVAGTPMLSGICVTKKN
jgi:outer membrane protein assembly factor BamB